jgi:hypothetical protein
LSDMKNGAAGRRFSLGQPKLIDGDEHVFP